MSSEEQNGSKKNPGLVVTLCVIGVLIVLLGCLGVYYFFFKGTGQNVYYQAIDNVANHFGNNIEIIQNNYAKPTKISGDISFDLKTNDSSLKDLANIINKLKIDVENTMDFSKGYIGSNYNVNYNNSDLIKLGTEVKDQDFFVSLGELYPKKIKISDFNASPIITLVSDDTYNHLMQEIATIIKNNLKEEYFSSEKETITYNNKEVNVTNHKLTFKNEEIYEFEYNVLDGMLNNEYITSSFSYILGISEKEVKTNLEEARDEVNPEDYQDLFEDQDELREFNVYMDNSKVLKVEITSSESKLEFVLDNDYYNIYLNDENIGKLKINDEVIGYELSNDSYSLKLEIASDNINGEINSGEYVLTFNLKENKDNSVVGSLVLSEENTSTKLAMNINLKKETVNNVSIDDVKDYVELNDLTEEDYNTISENLTKMPGLLSLTMDIMGNSGNLGL